jgi:PAS domain S-box-containing protein
MADLGFAVTYDKLFFLISSTTFFTSLLLGILLVYLLEGPRALRLAVLVVLMVSFFYFGLVVLLPFIVDTSKWVSVSPILFRVYFWSITALLFDVFFLPISWEFLGKLKRIALPWRVYIVMFSTLALDSLIFDSGAFGNTQNYLAKLFGDLLNRVILTTLMTPIASFFLKSKGFDETQRKKPSNFWEIFNFRSDLESRIKTMEEVLREQSVLEKKLKEAEERYALAVEGANAGIWDYDVVNNRIMYSAKFCQLLGFNEGDLKTTIEDFLNMLHPDDVKRTQDFLNYCFREKKRYDIEYRLKNKDGTYRWYMSGGVISFDAKGKPLRLVGSTIDINEKKLISESLKEKITELERFNKLMVDRELKMVELKEELARLKKN